MVASGGKSRLSRSGRLLFKPYLTYCCTGRRLAMLRASGLQEFRAFGPEMRTTTLVIDAVLGTGLKGAATGAAASAIREINGAFPFAKVFAVDLPSGLSGQGAWLL